MCSFCPWTLKRNSLSADFLFTFPEVAWVPLAIQRVSSSEFHNSIAARSEILWGGFACVAEQSQPWKRWEIEDPYHDRRAKLTLRTSPRLLKNENDLSVFLSIPAKVGVSSEWQQKLSWPLNVVSTADMWALWSAGSFLNTCLALRVCWAETKSSLPLRYTSTKSQASITMSKPLDVTRLSWQQRQKRLQLWNTGKN